MGYQSYNSTAMGLALDSIMHQQSISIPPINEKDLRKIARVCHFKRAAVAAALEGIRAKKFHMLCDDVASMGITPSEDNTSKVLTIVTALLLVIAVVRAVRAVSKRLW